MRVLCFPKGKVDTGMPPDCGNQMLFAALFVCLYFVPKCMCVIPIGSFLDISIQVSGCILKTGFLVQRL